MRLANLEGRAVLVAPDGTAIDIADASAGRFGPEVPPLYDRWAEFTAWAAEAGASGGGEAVEPARLGPPSPRPGQILAIGLNYGAHAHESGYEVPTLLPPVFPKFRSALAGPVTRVVIPQGAHLDWEVELVLVIGRATSGRVAPEQAWDVLAGVTVGQDLSDRVTQFSTPAPQFGLGKSFPGFAPTGPWLVTPDELADRDAIGLQCALDGVVMQEGNTRDLLFSVPRLVSDLSGIVDLEPGDLIFTGTPSGVGMGRTPPVFIEPGQELVTTIDGIGELRQTFVAAGPDGPRAQVP